MKDAELARSWATILQMLRDRGHAEVPELDAISPEDLSVSMAGKLTFHVDAPSIRHRIVYELGSRFKSANVRKLLDGVDVATVILVVREWPTSTSLKGLEAIGKNLQLFNVNELQFNVSAHVFVPKHVAIRDEAEIERILARYQVKTRFQFPLILTTDPMARYLGLSHGQLVRVTRASPSTGHYVLYRCCMKA